MVKLQKNNIVLELRFNQGMKCYICGGKAVVIFEYKSSLSRKCREARCKVCAEALRESNNTIYEEIQLETTQSSSKTGSSNQSEKSPQPPHILTDRSKI
jgi:hypothetical protein